MKKNTVFFYCCVAAIMCWTNVNAQNLVTNGNFAAWTNNVPDGWVLDPNTTTIFSQGNPNGLVVAAPTATTKIYTTVAIEAGETYDLSFTYTASHAKFRIWSGWVDSIPQTAQIAYQGTSSNEDELRTNNDYYEIATTASTKTIRFTSLAGKSLFRLEFRYYKQDGSSFTLNNLTLTKTENSNVSNNSADKQIQSVRYFDVLGKEITEHTRGIVIVKTIYTDGTSTTVKELRIDN